MRKLLSWYTDTHLNLMFPWSGERFIEHLKRERPSGLIITGDISDGVNIGRHLRWLASNLHFPIYFTLGNHDVFFRKMSDVYDEVRALCLAHTNLFWMQESGIIKLNEDTALAGIDGWFDVAIGNPDYITFTADWLCVDEFRSLPDMKSRIDAYKALAQKSADIAVPLLEEAFKTYKTVYLMTHVPPWQQATRDVGTIFEQYWMPYNINHRLGVALEDVMAKYPDRKLVVLCGHTHNPLVARIAANIVCRVGKGKYIGTPSDEERIVI